MNAQATQPTNQKPLSETAKKFEGKFESLLKEHGNVSKVIRFLSASGLTKGEIAKVTGKRYQHVRNVLITPLTTKQPAAPVVVQAPVTEAAAPAKKR